jgi:hypothetical protein
MKNKTLAALVAAIAMLATGCATANSPSDLMGVHYSGGSVSSKEFKDCLEPSTRSGFDPGDGYYFYPTRQISYEASAEENAERGRFTVVSDDNAELYVPIRVTMQLDTNCDTLRKFHEEIGSRYAAYIRNGEDENDDGEWNSADYPDGWVNLLNDVVGKPLDATVDRIAQSYDWREVWNDEAVRVEMENEIEDSIEEMVNEQAGGDFFTDFTVLVNKPDPVDEGLKQAIADEQNAVAQANAAKAKAEADIATAEAQERLAKAKAEEKRAEIAGFGGIEDYLRYMCITTPACGNPFRDQFLYGGSPAGGQ